MSEAEISLQDTRSDLPENPCLEELPLLNRVRLIWVGHAEPSFLYLTLQLQGRGCQQPHFRWVSTSAEALHVLRSASFDVIVIATDFTNLTHQSALMLAQALRTSGHDEPILIVAGEVDDASWTKYVQAHCDVVITKMAWNSPVLIPEINRVLQRIERERDHQTHRIAKQKRLLSEQNEAERLLKQQHKILLDMEHTVVVQQPHDRISAFSADTETNSDINPLEIPHKVKQFYKELLRTFVIMGSGSLSEEITQLVQILTVANYAPRQIMQLHLDSVQSLVTGLGNRSTRHVMTRADLLALDLMIQVAETYQQANSSQ